MAKKRVNPREKIMQVSVGFPFRHHQFFAEAGEEFKLELYCRQAVEKQIKMYSLKDPKFEEYLKEVINEETFD